MKPFSAAAWPRPFLASRKVAGAPANLDDLLMLADAAKGAKEYLRWITASQGDDLRLITVEEICYFQADNKYTLIATAQQDSLIRRPSRS